MERKQKGKSSCNKDKRKQKQKRWTFQNTFNNWSKKCVDEKIKKKYSVQLRK